MTDEAKLEYKTGSLTLIEGQFFTFLMTREAVFLARFNI